MAFGAVLVLWRRGGVLGAGGDGPPAAGDPGGGVGRGGRGEAAAGLERWVPDPAERAFLAPRLGALLGVAEPGLGRDGAVRRVGGCSLSGWPRSCRWSWCSRSCNGPMTGCWISSSSYWIGRRRAPIFMLTLARPELSARREGWPAGRRGATWCSWSRSRMPAMRALLDGVVDGLPGMRADADRRTGGGRSVVRDRDGPRARGPRGAGRARRAAAC